MRLSFIIAFTGIDGAGKTFYSKWLYNHLRRIYGKGVHYVHIFSYRYMPFKHMLSIIGLRNIVRNKLMGDPYHSKGGALKLYSIILLIDAIFTVFLWKIRGKIIISDRYFYDILAIMSCSNMLSFRTASYIARLIPRPDKIFLFKVDYKTAYHRKMEHPIDFFKRLEKFYDCIEKVIKPLIIDTKRYNSISIKKRILSFLCEIR